MILNLNSQNLWLSFFQNSPKLCINHQTVEFGGKKSQITFEQNRVMHWNAANYSTANQSEGRFEIPAN